MKNVYEFENVFMIVMQIIIVGQIPGGCYIRGILLCQDDDNVVIKTCARHVEEINQNGMKLNPF